MLTRLLVVGAAVLIVAGGVLYVAPRNRRVTTGKPTPSAATLTPTATVSAPTPVTPTAATGPSPTQSASSPELRPSAPAPAGSSPAAGGIRLVDGPYGFKYPEGWTLSPLAATSSSVQRAHVTDPASSARIDYLVDATSAIYNPDRIVNLVFVRQAIPCQTLTTYVNVPNKGPRYTCPPDGGRNVQGMVLILPYPQGFRLLHLMLPPADDAIAAQILSGFH